MEAVFELAPLVGEALVLAFTIADDARGRNSSDNSSASTGSSSASSTSTSTPPSQSTLTKHVPRTLKAGYFIKQGHVWKTWKKRWFSLRGSTITYYTSNKEESPLGEIEIEGAHVHVATRSTDLYYGDRECIVIETPNFNTFYMFPNCKTRAEAERVVREWLAIMEKQGAHVVQAPPTSNPEEACKST